MIGIQLQGRLGNQMFQYAFGYNLAKRYKTILFFDNGYTNISYVLPKYFRLGHAYKLNNYIFNKPAMRNRILKNFYVIRQEDFSDNKSLLKNIRNNTIYKGFFQSEDFFVDNRKQVIKKFQLKKKILRAFYNKYGELLKIEKTLVLHFRGGDYFNYGSDELGGKNLALPFTYYKNCLDQVKNLNNYNVIFISDAIEYVKKSFFYKNIDINYISTNEIFDFLLLVHADKLIVSNSSFAWWGAYLNYKNAEVFAPKYWLGFKVKKEYPEGIIQNNWKQIEVE